MIEAVGLIPRDVEFLDLLYAPVIKSQIISWAYTSFNSLKGHTYLGVKHSVDAHYRPMRL